MFIIKHQNFDPSHVSRNSVNFHKYPPSRKITTVQHSDVYSTTDVKYTTQPTQLSLTIILDRSVEGLIGLNHILAFKLFRQSICSGVGHFKIELHIAALKRPKRLTCPTVAWTWVKRECAVALLFSGDITTRCMQGPPLNYQPSKFLDRKFLQPLTVDHTPPTIA